MAKTFSIANWRIPRGKWPRPIFSLRRIHLSATQLAPAVRIIEDPIEEEVFHGNRLIFFHPTKPGEILDGRFKTIAKLGFGGGSTVWLAENLNFKRWQKSSIPRFVSIKIAVHNADKSRESDFFKRIDATQSSHEGRLFIRTPIDEFKLAGPDGTHECLVYEPMRETLSQFQDRWPNRRFDPHVLKFHLFFLLQALDYLHTECGIIHTGKIPQHPYEFAPINNPLDIKDDNIMMTIENDAALTDFVKAQKKNPQSMHVRAEDGRATYLSQDDFGPPRGSKLVPKLTDFDIAFPRLGENHYHLSAIQSHRSRAPEVLLGCPWSTGVDIWSVGILMWNLLEDVHLFDRPVGADGQYDAHVHLAQMVGLLGDPPEHVIKGERILRKHQLDKPIMNFSGKLCNNMNEFWGGPFFDDDNQIFRKELVAGTKKLADTVTELAGEEKELFLDFASGMLHWVPQKRKTARELLQHPFLAELNWDQAS
ncbi:kinase domain protein [Nemania sp. NC0429]|nr:kinase domain protein [Nemania sp. NC0429]